MKWEVLLVDDYHLNYNSSIYIYFRSFLCQFCGNLVYNMQNKDKDKASITMGSENLLCDICSLK